MRESVSELALAVSLSKVVNEKTKITPGCPQVWAGQGEIYRWGFPGVNVNETRFPSKRRIGARAVRSIHFPDAIGLPRTHKPKPEDCWVLIRSHHTQLHDSWNLKLRIGHRYPGHETSEWSLSSYVRTFQQLAFLLGWCSSTIRRLSTRPFQKADHHDGEFRSSVLR